MNTILLYPEHSVASIDRFADLVEKFLDEMSDRRCEEHIAARMNGIPASPCEELATVSDIETELTFCPAGYRRFHRGEFDGR